ncbi:hypothetical protein tb265_20200 [Gemmatimonadetes bacterium T265]|nr:hypothetical protein tb265_20200 [Gemmatimonadetes bacterium T265]
MTDLPDFAIARTCTARFPHLPRPALATLVGHLDGLAAALSPDDRSVLVALLAGGGLAPAVRAWWVQRRPALARASLERAWAAELRRQGLPFVSLPDRPWPALRTWDVTT